MCTDQPELPPGHARAAGMGWNHRFDDVQPKKPIPKTFLKKELCLFKNHEKSKKARFYGDFHFFRDFRINVTLSSEKYFGIGFFIRSKHY